MRQPVRDAAAVHYNRDKVKMLRWTKEDEGSKAVRASQTLADRNNHRLLLMKSLLLRPKTTCSQSGLYQRYSTYVTEREATKHPA